MKFHIDVDPIGPRWRATCRVPKGLGVITGSRTEEGPWAAGEGKTPEEAIKELICAVGRAYLQLATVTRCRLCGTRADAISVYDRCRHDGPWHEWEDVLIKTCPGCGGQDTHRDGCTEAQQEASEEKMAADEKQIIVCKHCGHDLKSHGGGDVGVSGPGKCRCHRCPGWEPKE